MRHRHLWDGDGRVNGPVPPRRRHQGQALRVAARPHPDAPAVGRGDRERRRYRHPGRAVRRHQAGDVPAQRRIHRPADRAHRGGFGSRPLVHRQGSPGIRVRRPHHHPRRDKRSPIAMNPDMQPQARYILPSFVEHSSWGVKESNPYNKLFEERIIFLGVQVDDASANDIMAQLLVLESLDPDRDITMYINSPGGGFTSLMAIYDTMQYVRADIQTVCLGQAASAAAVLLAAGTPGKRMALPNARVLIHQPGLSGVIQGQFSDLEIQAAEIERMRTLMETTLAHHTGKDPAVIRKDTDRDKILTAEEAKNYGIIDTLLEYRKLSAQSA